jgi:quinol monooxygenase YgiN
MLIIAGTIDMNPEHVDAFIAAAIDMMQATLKETGCQAYSFTVDQLTPGRIRLYEKWDSQADLEAHFVVPHMAAFQAATADLDVTGRDLLKYEIASEGPVR